MNKNLMNWLDSRKTHLQATAHPAHKQHPVGGLASTFIKPESAHDAKLRVQTQNLADLRIKEYSERAGQRRRRFVA